MASAGAERILCHRIPPRTLQRGASVGNGVTAGKYGRKAGKRGASGYEPAGKNTPIATGLKAA